MKILRGNPGHRPINPSEPKPATGNVRVPAWLPAKARRLWRVIAPELDAMGVLTNADPHALALLCDAYLEYIEARQVIRRLGLTYTTIGTSGAVMHRAYPEVAIAADAWRRVSAMLSQFGLTPASRSKLSTRETGESDPFEAFLTGKAQ